MLVRIFQFVQELINHALDVVSTFFTSDFDCQSFQVDRNSSSVGLIHYSIMYLRVVLSFGGLKKKKEGIN